MTKRGIIDPWRAVEPLRPERMDLDDIDFDADLAIPGQYVIRFKHAAFNIVSVKIAKPCDALDVLANAVGSLFANKTVGPVLVQAGIGARCRDGMWNVPSDDVPHAKLTGDKCALWFTESLDRGTRTLAKILRAPAAAFVLRQSGITVMLTT